MGKIRVAALYVQTGGCYFGIPDVDPWDEPRDARLYAGPWPVVAHPPCSRWCQLARLNEKRWGRVVGADGGCFGRALAVVRKFGGVLEHPAFSIAWDRFDLPRPLPGWRGFDANEYVCEVYQRPYGSRARKRTWLYVSSIVRPADLDWSNPAPTATIGKCRNHGGGDLPRLHQKEASATPPAFRDVLLTIARNARGQ